MQEKVVKNDNEVLKLSARLHKDAWDKLRYACRNIVNNRLFSLAVFALIIFSVAMLLMEIVIFQHLEYSWIHLINDSFFYIFTVELFIRLIALGSIKKFTREYWLDIIAIIPLLPHLRILRLFRVLRIIRVMSLMFFLRRHLRVFASFFRKNLVEYFVIFLIVSFVVLFGTILLVHFEHIQTVDRGTSSFSNSFWIIIFSLFSGEYVEDFPLTPGGKLVIIAIVFCNMSLFAILTGTVSSIMVTRLKEGAFMGRINYDEMEGHVVICGWSDHVSRIIGEFHADSDYKNQQFVIITEMPELPDMSGRGVDMSCIHLINQDFTSVKTLNFANIKKASSAIILADLSKDRTSYDADARTVLASLTIEKLNPGIYTCAELLHSENEAHLSMSNVESIVLSSKLTALMIAQAAMKEGVLHLYNELIHPSQGNTVFKIPFPEKHIGKSFDDVMLMWKKDYQAILIGVIRNDNEIIVNPDNIAIEKNDKAMAIALKKPRVDKV
jgi:voltage-gated potassium channel